MTQYRRGIAVALTVLMVASTLAVPVGGASAGVVPADERFDVAQNVDVWEQSVLTFRADYDDAPTSVPLGDVRGEIEGQGETSLNRDPLGVVNADEEVTLTFDQRRATSSADALDGEEVQLVAARIDPDRNVPTTFAGGIDLFTENPNENATFEIVENRTLNAGSATEFSYTPGSPGNYVLAVAATNGSTGFNVTDGDISPQSPVTIVGMESLTVQRAPADVRRRNDVTPGENVSFVVDARGIFTSSDDVTHVVAVYDEETFTDAQQSQFVLTIEEGELNEDLNLTEDSTLKHSINETDGVANIEEGTRVNEIDISDGRVDRSVQLGSVVDFVAEDIEGNPPNTEVTGDTVLYASVTSDANAGPESTLEVETNESWEPGTYRYVYIGTLEDNASATITATDTFSIGEADDGGDDDDGGGGGGGGGGSDGATLSTRIEPTLDSASGFYSSLDSTTTSGVEYTFDEDATGVIETRAFNGETPSTGSAGRQVVDHYEITAPETAQNRGVTVSITVRSERIQQLGGAPEDYALKAWDGAAWQTAETTVQETDRGVRYTARLSALPQFLAIATPESAQQPTSTPVDPGDPTPTPGQPSDGVTSTPPDDQQSVPTATPAVGSPAPDDDGGGLVDILLPVVLLLVIATGLAVAWVLATQNVASFYEKWR